MRPIFGLDGQFEGGLANEEGTHGAIFKSASSKLEIRSLVLSFLDTAFPRDE